MPDAVDRRETGSDRSGAGTADPRSRAAPSLAILGADALLAAQPATAVQLAHACRRIGYQAIVPATWGDELIAGGCLRHMASRRSNGDTGPAIFCACPYVAHRLLAVGPDLEPFLASFVSPPVAVARYLRTLYTPTRIRLTYVGRCPGAADDAIDARLTPEELLAVLVERGVDVADQPRVFDSVIPPDRRRFRSQPGGFPAAEMLRRFDPDASAVEVTGPELAIELAQVLLSKDDVLIDVATRVGCACSGAVANVPPEAARAGVTSLEPPRASSPIVDDRVPVPIELPLPSVARDPVDVVPSVASRRSSGGSRVVHATEPPSREPPGEATAPARRRSPTQGVTVRPPGGAVPTTRSGEGRALPRAYVARRNTGARGRGPSTPPRGEAAQRLGAAGGGSGESGGSGGSSGSGGGGGSGGRAGNGGSPGGGGVSPRADRVEPSAQAPGGEVPVRAKEPAVVAAAVGAAPDRADDPHGEPRVSAGETAMAERVAAPEPPPRVEREQAPAGPPASSPISEVTPPRTATFGSRTATLARVAMTTAHQRRALLGALLGVALLSASVGILAGRWLAARTTVAPGATR